MVAREAVRRAPFDDKVGHLLSDSPPSLSMEPVDSPFVFMELDITAVVVVVIAIVVVVHFHFWDRILLPQPLTTIEWSAGSGVGLREPSGKVKAGSFDSPVPSQMNG